MDNDRDSRKGQLCELCKKPLRTFKADHQYGFKWKRKFHKKCAMEGSWMEEFKKNIMISQSE